MNNTIDDFFNEINDLEQSKQPKQKQTGKYFRSFPGSNVNLCL